MTSCPGEGILTCLGERLLDKTVKEIKYFCDFDDHFRKFVDENDSLVAELNQLKKDIDDAKNIRNENQIEYVVQNWMDKAEIVIQENTQIRDSRSCGWRPYWKYRQGKMLSKRILVIRDHMQKRSFERVTRQTELLGMKYHAPTFFIEFESRKTKLNQLTEALEDGNHYMIGLQGMGGTGKTTLATQVGNKLEESKVYEKVIFVVVSNPPDVSKIRGDIARQLDLKFDEKTEEEHSEFLLSRISNYEKKLLIILDDMWKELDLKEIGIPFGEDHKNCYVLITSRHSDVCEAMRCQPIIHLHTLGDEEALKLFMFHATRDDDNSSSHNLEGLAREFLKECGGLPIAIAALASTLRNWPTGEWHVPLSTLQCSKPFVDVDEDLMKVYNCLKLSYDNLNDEKARKLLSLCSIFPEHCEIPINLIIRLNIGLGIFGEFDEYCVARNQALKMKNKLIASSLLLKVEKKGCVKMHNLVREVVQWIEKENTQVIMDSRMTLKADKRFGFWSADDFPDQCDDTELEILLLAISGNFLGKDPNAFFVRMSRLKVLFLLSECDRKVPSPSLSQSLLSLKNIHTLILGGWEIGDITILENLQSLVTLELENCLFVELPREFNKLKKLRWLGLRECEIQKNNPFEVIERCSQLEEFYFVGNHDVKDWKLEDDKEIKDEIVDDIAPPTLQMFSIACNGFEDFQDDDNGLLKCFNPEQIEHLISEAMLKHLVGRSEILRLGKIGQTRWKSLIPDIIPLENGGMNNLLKLSLYEWAEIEYLINNSNHHYSNFTFFSNVVELHLFDVGVKKLYLGTLPSGFLKQLQILKLKACQELQNIFLDEDLKLPNLRELDVKRCPMFQPSIFQLSVARSLVRLEELVIEDCRNLKSLISLESLEKEMMVVDSQKNYGSLFPNLKSLKIKQCRKLERVSSLLLVGDLPKLKELNIYHCDEMKYLFGEYRDVGQVLQQEIMLPSLTDVAIARVPNFIGIFEKCKICMPTSSSQFLKEASLEKSKSSRAFWWTLRCCFTARIKDTDIGVSNVLQEQNTLSQETCASSKRIVETFCTAECLMRQPLNIQNIREMSVSECSKLKSLFSVSVAATIMVEKLEIRECGDLKHIIAKEVDDDCHLNSTSIFPKLQELDVNDCPKLKFIFPSTFGPYGLQKLESIYILDGDELEYVFGRYDDEECVSNENENIEPHIHLPSLKKLSLTFVPRMINIVGSKSSQFHTIQAPKLEHLKIWYCKKLEVIFPLSFLSSLQNLKSLIINDAAELKYVFGKHEHGECLSNENESDDLHIHLPALETLQFSRVPKMNICAKKCYLSIPALQDITLGPDLHQEFIAGRTFPDLMAHLQVNMEAPKDVMEIMKDVKKLTNVKVCDLKIEEFLNLEGVEIEDGVMKLSLGSMWLQNLYELGHVWKGPKYILSLHNLERLTIASCKMLRAIFSVSIVKSLPQLFYLSIERCDELVEITEESDEDHSSNQLCFPKLDTIEIRRCNSLKYLFSISTCGMFPKLRSLEIVEAPKMEQVFIHNKDDVLNMATTFPELREVRLEKLPMLITICEGIDFDTLRDCKVGYCPKFQVAYHIQDGGSENQETTNVLTNSALSNAMERTRGIDEGIQYSKEGVASRLPATTSTDFEVPSVKETHEEAITATQSVSSSITPQPPMAPTSRSSKSKKETAKEIEAKDFALTLLEKQPLEGSLDNCEEREKEGGKVVPDPDLKLPEPSSSSFKRLKTSTEIAVIASESSCSNSKDLLVPSKSRSQRSMVHNKELVRDMMIGPSTMSNIPESTPVQVVTEEATIIIQPTYSDSRNKETRVSSIINIAQGSKDIEEEAVRIHDVSSQKSSMAPNSTNPKITKSIKDPMEQNYPKDDDMLTTTRSSGSDSWKQSMRFEKRKGVAGIASKSSVTTTTSKSVDAISNESAEEGPTSEDVLAATMSDKQKTKERAEEGPTLEDEDGRVAPNPGLKSLATTSYNFQPVIDRSLVGPNLIDQSFEEARYEIKTPQMNAASMEKSAKQDFQKHDSSNGDEVAIQSAHLEIAEEIRDGNVKYGPKLEKDDISTEDNTSLPNVIPSSHHQSQTESASSSSPLLEIGEIFQLVELKDGEAALLAKALELYPQLRLPFGQRPNPIIAFSYRVLVDILIMLATKTPFTITASDRTTLEANLGATTFFGFDKDWIESVRAKVFGIEKSDVMVAEEKMSVIEEELEKCDIALDRLHKKRVEAKEKFATAQKEFEAVDNELFDLLENRRNLVMKMIEFRRIIGTKDKPFGI